jgi:hypothetical protein
LEADVVRRTISLPAAVDAKVRKIAEEEGSYSAAVARLIEEATRRGSKTELPSWIGSFEDPGLPRDFGRNHEKYLKEAMSRIGRRR